MKHLAEALRVAPKVTQLRDCYWDFALTYGGGAQTAPREAVQQGAARCLELAEQLEDAHAELVTALRGLRGGQP